jgi:hypothetical protein
MGGGSGVEAGNGENEVPKGREMRIEPFSKLNVFSIKDALLE